MLVADLERRVGAFALTASLRAAAGETLVLVGESGAGKSTTLNLLAGLGDPDAGSIALDAAAWYDGARRFSLPAAERPVGYVFQDYALFPHLSVADNIGFGPRAAGWPARAVRPAVMSALERYGLAALADRRPDQLSGGQRQRVALARALVLEPRLLLLDEPLAALDLSSRREVRTELRAMLAEHTGVTILVTHSPMEALVFGDRLAVMHQGRIVQEGTRDELLCHPRSPYVAELMGLNFFRGRVTVRDATGMAEVETAGGRLRIVDPGGADEVFIAVDPRQITLHLEQPEGTAQNVFAGRIAELSPEPPFGERLRVALDTHPPLVAEITARAAAELGLERGREVYASFKATGASAYS